MSGKTSIEWTDATWNPTRGCSLVSAGCKHCYAMKFAGRWPWGKNLVKRDSAGNVTWNGNVELVESALTLPLKWRAPRRIFVDSESDLFHDGVPDEWIDRVFAVMALAPQHTFQVLTKRPERMRRYLADSAELGPQRTSRRVINRMDQPDWLALPRGRTFDRRPAAWPLPNVWLGVSVEDQATADERIPLLLQTPAALRFVSYEPALGPVDFLPFVTRLNVRCCPRCGFRTNRSKIVVPDALCPNEGMGLVDDIAIDWVICGGESGPSARPMHPAWARATIKACKAAGTACFFKQEGSWTERRPHNYCRLSTKRYSHESVGMFEDGGFYQANEPDSWGARGMVTLFRHGGHNSNPAEWPEDLRIREFPR
jgi:protein gp37